MVESLEQVVQLSLIAGYFIIEKGLHAFYRQN